MSVSLYQYHPYQCLYTNPQPSSIYTPLVHLPDPFVLLVTLLHFLPLLRSSATITCQDL